MFEVTVPDLYEMLTGIGTVHIMNWTADLVRNGEQKREHILKCTIHAINW